MKTMKTKVSYLRKLCAFALASLLTHFVWAALPTTNVISWNVAQDDSNQRNTGLVDTTAESYPTLAGDIPGSCWNQPANYSAEVVVSEFNAETGNARQLTTTFSDYISGGYNIKPDGAETPAYRKAYLARLNNGSVYGQVTINNIPYLKYDLIVYFSGASDVSVYKPLQINGGTYYKGQDGSTVVAASSDTWGDNSATEIAEGTNALVIRGLGDRKLILKNDGVVKNGICAVQIVDRAGTAKSLPIMLFNVYGGGSEVAGWSNVTQANGASIPSSGALSTNSVSFVAAMPNSNFGGNFAPANACNTDFESGTYVDVFGESHETIAAEVKASLSLPEDVVFDSSIYKTGVINGGYNGQVGTISGLSPDQGYVVYAGFGRKGNDVTYFKMESTGFGSADSIDYVTTVARTSGNVTVKATEYTEYTVGSMIGPGSTDGLLLVRMANVKPNANGNIVFSLGGGRSGLNWVAVAKVDIQTVAKIGNKNFSSLSAALAAAEAATSEEGKVIALLAPHTGNVSIASGVTIEMDVNNRITGVVSGSGTVKLSHASTATQGSLTTWIGDGKMTFGEFTGTVHLAAGRFNATTALVPATAKVKVTNGAQLFVDGGTWTNTIELEGAGYGNETTHIGRAALRFEQGNIDGATIESNATGDNAPAIGSYGSDRIFAFKLIGTGDIRLVLGSGSHTYKFTNKETTLSGTVTIVDANLTLEAEVSEGEDEFPNDIAGAGTLKKSGEGALTLSGNVSCAVKLAAGTIVSETVTGEVTTDVADKHVEFDAETNTYSLEEDVTEITFTVAGLPEHAVAYIQINNGETTPIEGGTFTAMPGDQFVVWFTPAEGYVGKTLSTGVVTVVYPMQTTEIQSPTAELMNIRPVVAIAAVGEPSMQPDVQGFGSLAEAITAGWYVFLTDAVTVDSTIVIDHSVVIDLQGHNVTGNGVRVFQVKSGTVEIDSTDADSGDVIPATISTIGSIDPDSSVIRIGGGDASAAPELTIDDGVTVTSAVCYGITAFGVGTQTLVVDGTVSTTGNRPAISGNGTASYGETTITINGTVSATAENAIYQPQAGTTTINGAVTGGIEAKAGAVTIKSGATVSARETTATHSANGDGCSTQGYAIAVVDNAGYKGGAVVTIEGGTITGPVAQVVDSEAKEANTLTITGGTFTVDPSAYVAEGYEATESEGVWTVSEKTGPKSWDEVDADTELSEVVSAETLASLKDSTVTASEIATWAKAKGVDFASGITIPVNALILNCGMSQTAIDAAAEAVVVDEKTMDAIMAAVAAGTDPTKITIPAEVKAKYPLATIELVESTEITAENGKFYRLKLTLK